MQYRKFAALGLAIIAPMGLSGCLLLPGQFDSELNVMADGQFGFTYKGQIQLVGLANLINDTLDAEGTATEFAATCYGPLPYEGEKAKNERKVRAKQKAEADAATAAAGIAEIASDETGTAASKSAQSDSGMADDNDSMSEDAAIATVEAASEDFEERDCTPAEVEQQKKDWEEQQAKNKKEKQAAKKMFAAMLGGIDPSDPKTIERFTKEVERLAAWNKVEHQGNGVFLIDYATKGRLADDFAFPVIPRYALGNPMVHITRWDNGRVRIEAPTFHNDSDVSIMSLMGAGGGMIPGMGGSNSKFEPVEVKGSFTIRTNARILANNTDEGPVEEGGLQVLRWNIGAKTYGPPMALLKLN